MEISASGTRSFSNAGLQLLLFFLTAYKTVNVYVLNLYIINKPH